MTKHYALLMFFFLQQVPDSSLDASNFSDLSHRRSSFANHLHLLRIQNPDSLAVAGFYYVGEQLSFSVIFTDLYEQIQLFFAFQDFVHLTHQ